MTDAPSTSTTLKKRSWSGCSRCKKRRQKCDEQRPECTRCEEANVECVYEVKLRWGGRSFAQSRFGTTNAVKKGNIEKGFIYTVSSFQSQPQVVRTPAAVSALEEQPVKLVSPILSPNDFEDSTALNIPATPSDITILDGDHQDMFPLCSVIDPLSNLGYIYRSLLDHFIHGTSHVISCHSTVQKDVCRVIVPAALQTPTLFYATTALSAIHLKSRAGMGSVALRTDPLISRLLSNSLLRLQTDLLEKDASKSSALLATIRTLFLCEVHAGGERPGTWRAHFEGAKALMLDIESWSNYSSAHRDSTRYFLKRWYNMTESFVALTADGLASGQLARLSPHTLDDENDAKVYLDEYAGFTTDLSPSFREIGAAAWERRNSSRPTILEEGDLDDEAVFLERCIWDRLERQSISPPNFRPGIAEKLSRRQRADFLVCNEIWHHMALIYIHRRISGLSARSPLVQASVGRILDGVESITATAGLTPLVVLTTPLFAAGCEAVGQDRDRVRSLLLNMFELLNIPNIYRALEVLESFWDGCEDGQAQDWDCFMRERNWDFLPY